MDGIRLNREHLEWNPNLFDSIIVGGKKIIGKASWLRKGTKFSTFGSFWWRLFAWPQKVNKQIVTHFLLSFFYLYIDWYYQKYCYYIVLVAASWIYRRSKRIIHIKYLPKCTRFLFIWSFIIHNTSTRFIKIKINQLVLFKQRAQIRLKSHVPTISNKYRHSFVSKTKWLKLRYCGISDLNCRKKWQCWLLDVFDYSIFTCIELAIYKKNI